MKPFRHENKNEGGKGISLTNTLGRLKRRGGGAIGKNGEARGGNEIHYPMSPGSIEAECYSDVFDIGPAEFIESFGEI